MRKTFVNSMQSAAAVCGAGALLMACTGHVAAKVDDGEIDDVGGEGGGQGGQDGGDGTGGGSLTPKPASFECNPQTKGPVEAWRRLTEKQYKNTLLDLITFAMGGDGAAATAVMNDASLPLEQYPKDSRASVPQDLHGSYRRLDQTVKQEHVESAYDVGVALGTALTTNARLGKVVGACATDSNASNDSVCVTDFIKRFGSRALRRPLTTGEVTFYQTLYASAGIDAAGFADVIAAFFGAPQFLYIVETGAAGVGGKTGVYSLTPYELAARLSFQLWDTMPDDALWKAAEDGSLAKDDVYAAQVDRLLEDKRARPATERFFTEWLKLEEVKSFDSLKDDPRYKAFAANDMPTASLRQSMIDDVVAMANHYTWTAPSPLRTMLESSASFARANDLAKIYGVAAWNGTGEPPALANRPGLLTRAAFLASASGDTRPIMKGVFIRQSILCDEIPPPPKGAGAMPPNLSTEMTTRQVVETITEEKGTVCAGCHAALINPLGFATEGFDALGRQRTMQKLFDQKGTLTKELPIDTKSVLNLVDGDTSLSSGPADLARFIADSGKADACMARQYFRYTFARWENEQTDGCTLEQLRNAVAGKNGTMKGLVRQVALAGAFKQRTFE